MADPTSNDNPPPPASDGKFGATAKELSRSPLQIIALFIVLVYSFAALVVGAGTIAEQGTSSPLTNPLTWFLVCFPVIVLGVFTYLVVAHHRKLYGPGDFRRDEAFLDLVRNAMPETVRALPPTEAQARTTGEADTAAAPKSLERIEPGPETGKTARAGTEVSAKGKQPPKAPTTAEILQTERGRMKHESKGLALVHTVLPSKVRGQKYDVFLYVVEDEDGALDQVDKAEFFFGRYWHNAVFTGVRRDGTMGVRTSAYGPFLAVCRATLRDGSSVILQRYADFEMGHLIAQSAAREAS